MNETYKVKDKGINNTNAQQSQLLKNQGKYCRDFFAQYQVKLCSTNNPTCHINIISGIKVIFEVNFEVLVLQDQVYYECKSL